MKPYSPKASDIGFLIKLIHDDIDRIINNQLRPMDLTSSQVMVLTFLSDHPDSQITMRDLQALLGVAHPTVIGLIRRLEKKGLVEVRISEDDHRMRNVSLTEKACDMLLHFPSPENFIEDRLMRGMTDEERRELQRLLGILHDNVR